MRKALFIIASLIFSFAYSQTSLKIQQTESLDEVKLYYDSIDSYIMSISIPIEIRTINLNDSLWLSYAYNYANDVSGANIWRGTPVKIKINDEYVFSISCNSQQSDTCYYKFPSKYYLNPKSDLQDSLSQYLEKIKDNESSFLGIGTLKEFKKNHPALVDRLLRNDSIGFDVRRSPRKFVEFISFPAEY